MSIRAGLFWLALSAGCATTQMASGPPQEDARCRVWIEGLEGPQRPLVVENERAAWQDAFGPTAAARFGREPDEIAETNMYGQPARIGRYANRKVYLENLGRDGTVLDIGDGVVRPPNWPEGQLIRFNAACSAREAALGATSVFLRRQRELETPPLGR